MGDRQLNETIRLIPYSEAVEGFPNLDSLQSRFEILRIFKQAHHQIAYFYQYLFLKVFRNTRSKLLSCVLIPVRKHVL